MLTVTPDEMKHGKITALKIEHDAEHSDLIYIKPIGFEGLNDIKNIITEHYRVKQVYEEAKRDFAAIAEDFNGILAGNGNNENNGNHSEEVVEKPLIVERKIMDTPPRSVIDKITEDAHNAQDNSSAAGIVAESGQLKTDRIIVAAQLEPKDEPKKQPLPPYPIPAVASTSTPATPKVESGVEPKAEPKTPKSEAARLVNEVQIHIAMSQRGRNFNDDELKLEVSKHVPADMVDATVTEILNILQKKDLIKTKGRLHTLLLSLKKK